MFYPKNKSSNKSEQLLQPSSANLLPQHPVPRHEIHPGFQHDHAAGSLVTLTPLPVGLVSSSAAAAAAAGYGMIPGHHQFQPTAVVTVTNPLV